jgi:uncharacterized OsmC-like protein
MELSIRAVSAAAKETKIYAGNATLLSGVQLNLEPSKERASAVELLLSSWAGDVAAGFRARLEKRGVVVDALELSVRATLEGALVHLGVIGEEGVPRVASITAAIYLTFDGEEDVAHAALEEALARAPVHQTLLRATSIDLRLSIM